MDELSQSACGAPKFSMRPCTQNLSDKSENTGFEATLHPFQPFLQNLERPARTRHFRTPRRRCTALLRVLPTVSEFIRHIRKRAVFFITQRHAVPAVFQLPHARAAPTSSVSASAAALRYPFSVSPTLCPNTRFPRVFFARPGSTTPPLRACLRSTTPALRACPKIHLLPPAHPVSNGLLNRSLGLSIRAHCRCGW
ncbi:Uncharacterised protein [Actinobaculum suis]|uniref:Uncharacterized protein n=1 Tax=Actinobaculum suis TaxID=1657 RepID=A0A7Z8YBA3_9ACTO|nr:Uncharacterised protein [Actinobaculum suis]